MGWKNKHINIPTRKSSGVSLFLGVPMSQGLVAERVREGRKSALPPGKNSLEQGHKQGLLVHSEQIGNGGGGHWISPLSTVLKFKHQSVI